MKNNYKISVKAGAIALVLGLLMPISAFAREEEVRINASTSAEVKATTSPREKLNELREKAQEKKDQIKEKVDSKREETQNRVKDRLDSFIKTVIERLTAATERFDKIALRIESRITKLESEGVDESKAKELLVTAKTKISVAKAGISNIHIAASSTVATSTDLKVNYQAIKDAVEKSKEDLKAAQSALVEVIRNMKPGQNKLNATTTAKVEIDN